MTDDELAGCWLACALGRSITHEGSANRVLAASPARPHEGARLIDEGTRRNSAAVDAAERYDRELTRCWTDARAEAVAASDAADADAFPAEHPEFRDSSLFGPPAWMRR